MKKTLLTIAAFALPFAGCDDGVQSRSAFQSKGSDGVQSWCAGDLQGKADYFDIRISYAPGHSEAMLQTEVMESTCDSLIALLEADSKDIATILSLESKVIVSRTVALTFFGENSHYLFEPTALPEVPFSDDCTMDLETIDWTWAPFLLQEELDEAKELLVSACRRARTELGFHDDGLVWRNTIRILLGHKILDTDYGVDVVHEFQSQLESSRRAQIAQRQAKSRAQAAQRRAEARAEHERKQHAMLNEIRETIPEYVDVSPGLSRRLSLQIRLALRIARLDTIPQDVLELLAEDEELRRRVTRIQR